MIVEKYINYIDKSDRRIVYFYTLQRDNNAFILCDKELNILNTNKRAKKLTGIDRISYYKNK